MSLQRFLDASNGRIYRWVCIGEGLWSALHLSSVYKTD